MTGCFRTTNLAALAMESGLRPAAAQLENRQRRFELHTATESTTGQPGQGSGFFSRLIVLAFSLSTLWRRTFYPFFPSTVRAVAARCKLPFALRPGLSREDRCALRKSQRK